MIKKIGNISFLVSACNQWMLNIDKIVKIQKESNVYAIVYQNGTSNATIAVSTISYFPDTKSVQEYKKNEQHELLVDDGLFETIEEFFDYSDYDY